MTLTLEETYALLTPRELAASIATDLAEMHVALGCYRPAPLPPTGAAAA